MQFLRHLLLAVVFVMPTLPALGDGPQGDRYDATIRPIFEKHCVSCHGKTKQEGGLRLDVSALVLRGGDRGPALLKGAPEDSLLYQAVSGNHDEISMPPIGPGLDAQDLDTLRAWIAEGAPGPATPEPPEAYRIESNHWAFQAIEQPAAPGVEDEAWVRNKIDRFVLARLEAEGIAPSPEADRNTLIRRLHFDLIGLPPTPEEVAAFVNDPSPHAYELVVSRLLASPHFGERWGRHWLDLARYADSDGYEKDLPRPYAYRYRDWVIDAINRDVPYSQFVVEQLAGDLLPNATRAQKIATGFHRNTMTNREGGADPEEDRVKQAYDRTDTTGQVLMGLTMNCAQCHTHKYDPITQREYFGMYAFFNQALEKDIPAATIEEQRQYDLAASRHEEAVAHIQGQIDARLPELEDSYAAWEAGLEKPLKGWAWLDAISVDSAGGADHEVQGDQSIVFSGYSPDKDTYTIEVSAPGGPLRSLRLEALRHASLNNDGPGRAHNGNFVLGEFRASWREADDDADDWQPIAIAGVTADYAQSGYEVDHLLDGDPNTGWAIWGGDNPNQDRHAVFRLAEPVETREGAVLRFELEHHYGREHNIGRLRLSAAEFPAEEIIFPDEIVQALRKPAEARRASERKRLLEFYGEQEPALKALRSALDALEAGRPEPPETKAQTMAENPDPPDTHIHKRGDFLNPGQAVQPHTPAVLHPLQPRNGQPDRLDLARWIVSPENPLTARVATNRIWEKLFGEGLVLTSEDFGTRTDPPSHPKLLDWLAAEFMARGWSVKDFIRLVVQSSAYRQSSQHRPELWERDPVNRLLARQNRFRVEGEITRDLFLAVSGLLHPVVGGPSVKPPLPPGVADLGYANSIKWEESEGADKYRRGLYIFFQRMIAYPQLMTFDCPDANMAEIKRSRSNTPLQALTLLNDPVFVECAQHLGKRLYNEVPEDEEARIRYAFQLCLARSPDEEEVQMLQSLLEEARAHFADAPEAAATLAGADLPEDRCAIDAAAHVVVARSLMNVDEFVTRE